MLMTQHLTKRLTWRLEELITIKKGLLPKIFIRYKFSTNIQREQTALVNNIHVFFYTAYSSVQIFILNVSLLCTAELIQAMSR